MGWQGEIKDNRTPDLEMDRQTDVSLSFPEDGFWDWQRVKAVGDFAAAHPDIWETIAARLESPHATAREIADKMGISHSTVIRRLKALRIG